MRKSKKELKKEKQLEFYNSLSEEEKFIYDQKKKKKALSQIKTDIIVKLFSIIIFFVILFTFFIGITTVKGNDMSPALRDGDTAIYLKIGKIMNSNAVIYKIPNSSDKYTIGRVIASEGAVITNNNGKKLLIDGNIQPEQKDNGVYYETFTGKALENKTITINSNEYLILGDKRDTSKDSREYGLIKDENIKGKIIMVIRRTII